MDEKPPTPPPLHLRSVIDSTERKKIVGGPGSHRLVVHEGGISRGHGWGVSSLCFVAQGDFGAPNQQTGGLPDAMRDM